MKWRSNSYEAYDSCNLKFINLKFVIIYLVSLLLNLTKIINTENNINDYN